VEEGQESKEENLLWSRITEQSMKTIISDSVVVIPIFAEGQTDPGKTRSNNEDAFSYDPDSGIFIVSDGVGGEQAGERASEATVKLLPFMLKEALRKCNIIKEDEMISVISSTIRDLNRKVFEYSQSVDELKGMGATLVFCLVREDRVFCAYMGDSSVFLVRDGEMECLTEDHSLVHILLQQRKINNKQAKTHPFRNVILRYIGMEEERGPDISVFTCRDGDRFLLCSDGLTDMVSEKTIASILWKEDSLKTVCSSLIDAANEAGGLDNITAVAVQIGNSRARRDMKVRVRRTRRHSMIAYKEEHKA